MVNDEASSALVRELLGRAGPQSLPGQKIAATVLQSERRKNTSWEENAGNFIGYLKNKSRTTLCI